MNKNYVQKLHKNNNIQTNKILNKKMCKKIKKKSKIKTDKSAQSRRHTKKINKLEINSFTDIK